MKVHLIIVINLNVFLFILLYAISTWNFFPLFEKRSKMESQIHSLKNYPFMQLKEPVA